jgi:hypothetical protein
MVKGHQRGTSHSKKKFDKIFHRNWYAKELSESKYRQRIVPEEFDRKFSKAEILKELYEEDEKS